MKITKEYNGNKLTNIYQVSETCILRDTVDRKNAKGEPIATLISNGQADEVLFPASVLYYLTRGLKIPAKYFTCMNK